MSDKEFCDLIDQHNAYSAQQWEIEKNKPVPDFKTVEEAIKYYNTKPLDEVFRDIQSRFFDSKLLMFI
ncbi:MAG: hypothetical protein J1E16_01870 [Muribaculaceae bacterium]|nr:hypothetical protein [Muribaculaceae bacterium]